MNLPKKTEVQTLMFDGDLFTERQAKAWAKKHGFRFGKVDETERYFRLRQRDPEKFQDRSFRTKTLTAGVKAVIGRPKKASKPKKARSVGVGASRGEVDETAADELRLFIDNDARLYEQQFKPIVKNLRTKMAKGVYDSEKAVKMFMHLTESGAKKYAKEFGSESEWHTMFGKPTREAAARQLRDSFEVEAKLGNYDDLLPKKYKGHKVEGVGESVEGAPHWGFAEHGNHRYRIVEVHPSRGKLTLRDPSPGYHDSFEADFTAVYPLEGSERAVEIMRGGPLTGSFRNEHGSGSFSVEPSSVNDGWWNVNVAPGELTVASGKSLPYGTGLGIIRPNGKIDVWSPAASKPRGYPAAARAGLEAARELLRERGLLGGATVGAVPSRSGSLRKSKGHIGWLKDGREVYDRAGEVYIAARNNSFDAEGYRHGRWESSRQHFERFRSLFDFDDAVGGLRVGTREQSAGEVGSAIHKGIAYFDTWGEARQLRHELLAQYPEARVVNYERGYAVQYRKSGPYWPELEERYADTVKRGRDEEVGVGQRWPGAIPGLSKQWRSYGKRRAVAHFGHRWDDSYPHRYDVENRSRSDSPGTGRWEIDFFTPGASAAKRLTVAELPGIQLSKLAPERRSPSDIAAFVHAFDAADAAEKHAASLGLKGQFTGTIEGVGALPPELEKLRSLEEWSQAAPGTEARNPEHHSYSLHLPAGEYHIWPPTFRRSGYLLNFASSGRFSLPQPGLWREIGTYRSAASAAKAAREDYLALLPQMTARDTVSGQLGTAEYAPDFIAYAAETMGLNCGSDPEPSRATLKLFDRYDSSVEQALREIPVDWFRSEQARSELLDRYSNAGLDVLLTLRGEGAGIWDGRWDDFFDGESLKKVERRLKAALKSFADDTGGGALNDAFMADAERCTGRSEVGVFPATGLVRYSLPVFAKLGRGRS